eukprot:s842_g7.t1
MGNLIIPGETELSGRIYKEPAGPRAWERNVKNMCFLNAILQCLYHTPMLRRNLALACESALVKDRWLIQLQQLFTEMDASRVRKELITATEMAALIQAASTNGEFKEGEQADAHEAFMLLVSRLLEGCISSRGEQLRRESGIGLSLTEKEQIEQSSLIGHIFGMSLSQSVKCKSCGDQSVRSRSEYCFCVTCPVERDRSSLDVKDGSCSAAAPVQWLAGLGPTVTFEKELTVQCESQKGQKTKKKVKYNLFGVIVYRSMGSNGGHYFAFVKTGRGPKEQWYLADDDDTRSVCWPEVLREEPFMLLYEAVTVVPPLVTDPEQRVFEEEKIRKEARKKAEVEAAAAEKARLKVKKEEAFNLYHQRHQADIERLRQSVMSWNHGQKDDAKPLEDPSPPGTELSSTTAGSEGRGYRHEENAWSPPREISRRRSWHEDLSKWSLFHSCQCSVPPAEFSDGLEDDAMHCAIDTTDLGNLGGAGCSLDEVGNFEAEIGRSVALTWCDRLTSGPFQFHHCPVPAKVLVRKASTSLAARIKR